MSVEAADWSGGGAEPQVILGMQGVSALGVEGQAAAKLWTEYIHQSMAAQNEAY
jgi:hypothetical protein